MEVGEHSVHQAEVVAGADEQVGVAGGGGDGGAAGVVGVLGGLFQGADGGGADGDDAAASAAGGVEGAGRFGGQFVPFGMDAVGADVLAAHGAEGVQADMEGNPGGLGAAAADAVQGGRGEVEAGGGGGDAAGGIAVHGLVAFRVVGGFLDVGGQGHFAEAFQGGFVGEADGADAVVVGRHYLNMDGVGRIGRGGGCRVGRRGD